MDSYTKRSKKVTFIYELAQRFLYDITPTHLHGEELDRYFNVQKKFKTKNDILYGLFVSLQNRQMAVNVIGFENEKRKPIFDDVLLDYDCDRILSTYTWESLFDTFTKCFVIKHVESKRNLWKSFAKSIISACKFIATFQNVEDFDRFVNIFTYNEFSSAALPMLLEREIFGIGFPLACDFLKELGYAEYPKPDVHIKDIFCSLDLCENNDYAAYKAVIEMARIVGDTPYKVDKTFWLIGSGRYYLHDVTIGRSKDKFIEHVKKEVASEHFTIVGHGSTHI